MLLWRLSALNCWMLPVVLVFVVPLRLPGTLGWTNSVFWAYGPPFGDCELQAGLLLLCLPHSPAAAFHEDLAEGSGEVSKSRMKSPFCVSQLMCCMKCRSGF